MKYDKTILVDEAGKNIVVDFTDGLHLYIMIESNEVITALCERDETSEMNLDSHTFSVPSVLDQFDSDPGDYFKN